MPSRKELRGLGQGLADVGGLLLNHQLLQMREEAILRMKEEYGLAAEGRDREFRSAEADKQRAFEGKENAKTREVQREAARVKDKPDVRVVRRELRDADGSIVTEPERDPISGKVVGQKPLMREYLVEAYVDGEGITRERVLEERGVVNSEPKKAGGLLESIGIKVAPEEDVMVPFAPGQQSQVPRGTVSGINGSRPAPSGRERDMPTSISGVRG